RSRRVILVIIPLLALLALVAIFFITRGLKGSGPDVVSAPEEPTRIATEKVEQAHGDESKLVSPPERVRIVTRGEGLYRVSGETLRALGIDLDRLEESGLALSNRGESVPFQWIGEGEERSLIFYGEASLSIYSPYNVYWLELGERASSSFPPADSEEKGDVGEGEAATVALARRRFEEQRLYLSTLPAEEDHWLWEPIYSRRGVTVTFALEAPEAGEAQLRLSLWSHSSAPVSPDHHVIVRVNGVEVSEETWDGQGRQVITGTLPSGTLRPGENELAILAPGDTGAPVEVSYLDWFEVTYPRRLMATEGRLDFWAEPGAYQVSSLLSGDVALWDITEPERPRPVSGFVVTRTGNGQSVRFTHRGSGPRHFWLAAGDGFLRPEAVEGRPAAPSLSPEEGADYIAIVPLEFMEAIRPLLDHRVAQGWRVFTVTPDKLFDAYTYGLKDPAAIRSFLAEALSAWPEPRPRFVLLVGDASYDPYDYLGGSERDLIPTALVQTIYVGQTASDNWLADVDEDGRPDIALGRFPAQTPEQVRVMVEKTIRVERERDGEWARRALLAADDDEARFIRMSDTLAKDYLSSIFEIERVYLGRVDDPHARLLEVFNQGVGLVNYIGHGSVTVWAKEKILSTEDVPALRNGDRLPLLVNMTCLTGYFHHPQMISLAEALLRAPEGGVVAALVPTSESLPNDQQGLAEAFYRWIVDPGIQTVGEAMMRAKQEAPLDQEGQRDVLATFNLLGDPALRLPWMSR
ncbi:MAG TPA: hypothetical protein G4O02_12240, partial [Caldilineae bacterium]|nr:hypothetical protein [Caldilineae bacterium]